MAEGRKQKAGHLALVMLFVVAAGTLRRLAAHQRRRVMSSTRLWTPPPGNYPTTSMIPYPYSHLFPFPFPKPSSAGMSCRLPAQIDFVCVFLTPAAIRFPAPHPPPTACHTHNFPAPFFASKII